MTIEEIIRGESKNIEFKETRPAKSETYTKTVVAFANTQGGKIVFGIEDKTRKVIGIDKAVLFEMIDANYNRKFIFCEDINIIIRKNVDINLVAIDRIPEVIDLRLRILYALNYEPFFFLSIIP